MWDFKYRDFGMIQESLDFKGCPSTNCTPPLLYGFQQQQKFSECFWFIHSYWFSSRRQPHDWAMCVDHWAMCVVWTRLSCAFCWTFRGRVGGSNAKSNYSFLIEIFISFSARPWGRSRKESPYGLDVLRDLREWVLVPCFRVVIPTLPYNRKIAIEQGRKAATLQTFFIFFGWNGQYLTIHNILYCNVLS